MFLSDKSCQFAVARHWLNAVRLKGDFPQKWRKPKLPDVSNAD
jgi:hypothetical protein